MTCQRVCIHVGLIKPVTQETSTNCPWNLQLTPYREIANIMEDKEMGPCWIQSSLKLSSVWAMVRKLKQRVAWVGQRMIESGLIKAASWTQQNRKMQVMSLESNNPKDGYSAGGKKHRNCFVLWESRLQQINNLDAAVLAKQTLLIVGAEQRSIPTQQWEGGKAFDTISVQPAQGFNFVLSISFSSSAMNEQQSRKKSEAIDKQAWENS